MREREREERDTKKPQPNMPFLKQREGEREHQQTNHLSLSLGGRAVVSLSASINGALPHHCSLSLSLSLVRWLDGGISLSLSLFISRSLSLSLSFSLSLSLSFFLALSLSFSFYR